jgi:hypothetical protein
VTAAINLYLASRLLLIIHEHLEPDLLIFLWSYEHTYKLSITVLYTLKIVSLVTVGVFEVIPDMYSSWNM